MPHRAIELYPDQRHDYQELRKLFDSHRAVVYQLPTGGGKTAVMGVIMQNMRKNGRRALIVVHRRELVEQTNNTLTKLGLNQDVGIVCTGWAPTPWAPIQIAMVRTWVNRVKRGLITHKPDLICVDEAHHIKAKTWEECLSLHPGARVLGATATPERLDGRGLSPPFEAMHCGMDIPELIDNQRLAPVVTKWIPVSMTGFTEKGLKTARGDFVPGQQEERMGGKFIAASVHAYETHAAGRRAIVFNVTKKRARETAEKFRERGHQAAYVGDDTHVTERREIFRRFAEGTLNIVCNVALIDEGFDVPDCDCVIDASRTKSVTRYLQRIGRALRYRPGKTALILDCVGNAREHGLPNEPRYWALTDTIGDVSEDGARKATETPVRVCHNCLTQFNGTQTHCPTCRQEYEHKVIHELDIELEDAHAKSRDPAHKPRRKAKLSSQDLGSIRRHAAYLVRSGQRQEAYRYLDTIAKENNYKPGWAQMTMKIITTRFGG